jgi:hypothetical protein
MTNQEMIQQEIDLCHAVHVAEATAEVVAAEGKVLTWQARLVAARAVLALEQRARR